MGLEQRKYSPEEAVGAENLQAFKDTYRKFRPRTPSYDAGLMQLLQYMQAQLDSLRGPEGQTLPKVFYDRVVTTPDELKEAIVETAREERLAITDRGRDHFGQAGAYFWDEVPELLAQKTIVEKGFWPALETLGGIDLEYWHERVNLMKPRSPDSLNV